MAEKTKEKEAAPAVEAPPAKKKGFMKWIILLLLLLGLGGGGYFAYMKYFKAPAPEQAAEAGQDASKEEAPKAEEKAAKPEKSEKSEKAEKGGEKGGKEGEKGAAASNVVTLPPFIVNLADPQGRRYLKLSMDVETKNVETAKLLTDSQAKVRDAIILLLSSKTYADLASLENKILLKEEIVERLNQVMGGPKVAKVYFTELVIQ